MRQAARILAAGVMLASVAGVTESNAAFFSFPLALRSQLDQIRLTDPVLAPMAHVRFCLRYQEECAVRGIDFRRRNLAMTVERWKELNAVNREVNRDIVPQANLGGLATEEWVVAPPAGDCNDYAVTKRHMLLARGWPSRALLLSEVVVPSGEHHLILVVRMKDGDLVLDNLNANIRTVAMTRYQYKWMRVESPYNPKFWSSVNVPGPVHVAVTLGEGSRQ
jgi:predicted transglutaminase-like cysteine proteinase